MPSGYSAPDCGGHERGRSVVVGELDIVAPSATDGQPVVGGLVYGRVWLSGRIVAQHTPNPA
jgi:hypothetical protein